MLPKIIRWPDKPPCEPRLTTWPHLYDQGAEGFRKVLSGDTRGYVELGTWHGASALLVGMLAPNSHIYCIDAFDGRNANGDASRLPDETIANLWDIRDRCTLIQADTVDGVRMLGETIDCSTIDVCYIDGDHSYDGARRDIIACRDTFCSAIIAGDDYDEPCGRAADDVFGDRLEAINQKFWCVRRTSCVKC